MWLVELDWAHPCTCAHDNLLASLVVVITPKGVNAGTRAGTNLDYRGNHGQSWH